MNDTELYPNSSMSPLLNQLQPMDVTMPQDVTMSKDNRLRLVAPNIATNGTNKALNEDSDYYASLKHQLINTLQTTLEIDEVLSLFFKTLQDILEVDHLEFKHKGESVLLTHGEQVRHSCQYSLSNSHDYLGEIKFTRRKRFSENELHIIEFLMGAIIYPIRNSLMFRAALRYAHTDPLTGLGSRSALSAALEREFNMASRQEWPLSLLVLDIDFFKRINDTYGHSTGDHVLKSVAEEITHCLRNTDQSFRYGGEEFVIVLGKTDQAQAMEVADRIRGKVEKAIIENKDSKINVTISIGVAQASTNDDSLSLFDRADKALYQAKNAGRNQSIAG